LGRGIADMANTGSLLSRHLRNGTSTYYTYEAAGIPRREKFTTDGTDGHG